MYSNISSRVQLKRREQSTIREETCNVMQKTNLYERNLQTGYMLGIIKRMYEIETLIN